LKGGESGGSSRERRKGLNKNKTEPGSPSHNDEVDKRKGPTKKGEKEEKWSWWDWKRDFAKKEKKKERMVVVSTRGKDA